MSLYLGDIPIANGGSHILTGEIGDIGFAPLGIDESLNLRRYLNGQVIIQSQFVSFTNKVKAAIALYPSIATTEENWQAEKTNSRLGQCGKFVVDDTAGTIRLPAVVNAQGLTDLALLGVIKSESLPNHYHVQGASASVDAQVTSRYGKTDTGISVSHFDSGGSGAATFGYNTSGVYGSSSTYQDNAPVQQEAVQYPYYIVVNTGVEEAERPINNYQVNNVYSYGMSQYYKGTMNNNSWLRSQGQWNDGTVYIGMYNWILEQMNAGVNGFKGMIGYAWHKPNEDIRWWTTVRNPKVGDTIYGGPELERIGNITAVNQDGTITFYEDNYSMYQENLVYTESENINVDGTMFGNIKFANDYDFVINTANQTFRLPLVAGRVLVAKKEPTDGDYTWYNLYSDGWLEQGGYIYQAGGNPGVVSTTTFPKAFKNNDYAITMSAGVGNSGWQYANGVGLGTGGAGANERETHMTPTTFTWFNAAGAIGVPIFWEAKGYAEVPTQSDYTEINCLYYYVGDTLQNADLINVARIEEKIVDKADIDASNFNASGRGLLSGLGMPSNRYIDLTLGASGSTYTAPANGWFFAGGNWASDGRLFNVTMDVGAYGVQAATGVAGPSFFRVLCPVVKGAIMTMSYTLATIVNFRFVYAEGDQ